MTLAPILAALALGAGPVAFVAIAPGYPGTTAEAQASMDAFAAALGAQAGWPAGSVVAAYYEKDGSGLERLQSFVRSEFETRRDVSHIDRRGGGTCPSVGVPDRDSKIVNKRRSRSRLQADEQLVEIVSGERADGDIL